MQKHILTGAATAVILCGQFMPARAQFLGSADTFAVLAGSAVTNAGPTILSGDLGVGTSGTITGFPPGFVMNGMTHAGDMTAMQALSDAANAYTSLAGETATSDLSGQNLGSLTLTPGVYHFATSAFLTGVLTLDTQGNPNARFDFQIGSTLITDANSSVFVINSLNDPNVFWQVGTSATLGTGTAFDGHILALTSITVASGASIASGSAVAQTGAVTLSSNIITTPSSTTVPEPSALILSASVGVTALALRRRKKASTKSGL